MRTPWTEQEIERLQELYANHHTRNEIAEMLGRSEGSVQSKAKKLRLKYEKYYSRFWQQKDIDYLIKSWGTISQKTIAKKLGRSVNAVIHKATDLNLGAFLQGSTYITLNELFRAIGKDDNSVEKYMKSWIKKGFPVRIQLINNRTFKVVYLKCFWTWAEKNRSCIDFSKVPKYILGKEPEWVNLQRKIDISRADKFKSHAAWTAEEDERLKRYIYQFKYSYYELEQIFGRTCRSIINRLIFLGIKARPLEADCAIKWTYDEVDSFIQQLSSGLSYEIISCELQKSSLRLRDKARRIFGTAKIDDIRKLIELHGPEQYSPTKDNTG